MSETNEKINSNLPHIDRHCHAELRDRDCQHISHWPFFRSLDRNLWETREWHFKGFMVVGWMLIKNLFLRHSLYAWQRILCEWFSRNIDLLSTRLNPICWRIWSKVNFWDFKPYRRIHSILFNCKNKSVNQSLCGNDWFTWLNRYAGSDVEPVETFWEEVVRSKFRDSPGVIE